MIRALAGFLVAVVVGAVSGVAGVLVHQAWWGLALGLTAALVTLAWLPPGPLRVGFAGGWLLAVSRATITLPAGDYLVSADAAGWSFLAGSLVLVVAALASLGTSSGVRSGKHPARAEDHGLRGSAT